MRKSIWRGLTALVVVLLLSTLAVAAFAHGDKPPKPTCPEGWETIEEAEWVPRECHCPEGSHPGMGPFKDHCYKDNTWPPEEVQKECTGGYWTEPVCAPPPVEGCTDPEAWNYDPEADKDDGSCVYDVCPNLEGLQEEVPEGYVKPGKRCIPAPVPGPDRVDFQVEASWCRDDKKPDRKVIFSVTPSEGGYITMGGGTYEDGDSDFFSGGTYSWTGHPNEGFTPKGGGTISFGDCTDAPEEHPATGGGLLPYWFGWASGVGALSIGAGIYLIRRRRAR